MHKPRQRTNVASWSCFCLCSAAQPFWSKRNRLDIVEGQRHFRPLFSEVDLYFLASHSSWSKISAGVRSYSMEYDQNSSHRQIMRWQMFSMITILDRQHCNFQISVTYHLNMMRRLQCLVISHDKIS